MSHTLATSSLLWLTIIFLPSVLAGLLSFPPLRKIIMKIYAFAPLPALLVSLCLPKGSGSPVTWMFFEAQFTMDATGQFFLFMTSLLWLLAGIFSASYFSKKEGAVKYAAFYLLAMSGNLGLILAQDIFTFYFLFALMSFASYGLVVHDRTAEAFAAGKIYMILVVLGEAFVFSGLLLLSHKTGSTSIPEAVGLIKSATDIQSYLFLIFVGFGIKAGTLPLHMWLPLAHPVAPTPASAVLSGAMIKAGLIGWLRFLPIGLFPLPSWGYFITITGVVAAIYAALVGLTQHKVKAVLAYSSISQMGMMTILVGVGILKPELWDKCWVVLMVYAVHHALAKGALFLSVGIIKHSFSSPWVKAISLLAIVWPAMAVIGAPWSSGEMAKGGLKLIVKKATVSLPFNEAFLILVTVSSVTTALIMLHYLRLMWQMRQQNSSTSALPLPMWISWLFLVVLGAILPLMLPNLNFMSMDKLQIFPGVKLINFWPVPVAAGVIGALLAIPNKYKIHIPPGDILACYQLVSNRILQIMQTIISTSELQWERSKKIIPVLQEKLAEPYHRMEIIVAFFRRWPTFGGVLLAICVVLMFALL